MRFDQFERPRGRRVDVVSGDGSAVVGEPDGVVRTIVELTAEGMGQLVRWHLCLHPVEVRHRQVDLSRVAPEMAGMQREADGQKPQLGQDRRKPS
jgi:hypothetical protein